MKKLALTSLGFLALPVFVHAQRVVDANSLLGKANNLMNAIIPIFITFAVLWLIYAIVRYVIADSGDDKSKGSSMILWGIIGLAAILSIWGLVKILTNTLGLDNTIPQNQIPTAIPLDRSAQ